MTVTHDIRTMKDFAYARLETGASMPGVLEVPDLLPIGRAIEELLLVVQLLEPEEIRDRTLRVAPPPSCTPLPSSRSPWHLLRRR